MGKFFKVKFGVIIIASCSLLVFIFIVVAAVAGGSAGEAYMQEQVNQMRINSKVINSQLYATKYRSILNQNMLSHGYVTLERLVFYLQRKHNQLDVSTLSLEEWKKAYFENVNSEEKQMVPIKTICKKIASDNTFPTMTIQNGTNADGVAIDVIDLCHVDGVDVATSNDYNEYYLPLNYAFALRTPFTITSFVFESRDIDLDLSEEQLNRTNYHSGWDFAVPIGTKFYSICDGTISKIVNTQANDLSYNQSKNSVGNYVEVKCNNNLTAQYYHIKYKSTPFILQPGTPVKAGDFLGLTSTTGTSTGPHLHLGLKDESGENLDVMSYIDIKTYYGS